MQRAATFLIAKWRPVKEKGESYRRIRGLGFGSLRIVPGWGDKLESLEVSERFRVAVRTECKLLWHPWDTSSSGLL